MINTLLH